MCDQMQNSVAHSNFGRSLEPRNDFLHFPDHNWISFYRLQRHYILNLVEELLYNSSSCSLYQYPPWLRTSATILPLLTKILYQQSLLMLKVTRSINLIHILSAETDDCRLKIWFTEQLGLPKIRKEAKDKIGNGQQVRDCFCNRKLGFFLSLSP